MARPNRGTAWEAVLAEAVPDVDPRWTRTGRGARASLTWGRVGWVWQHVGLELKSGTIHELYASRTWLDVPVTVSVDAVGQDLMDGDDSLFRLDGPDAAGQVRRWAALVSEQVFARTLEQDLATLEHRFEQFRTQRRRSRWAALAGLRLLLGGDPRPVVDAAESFAAEMAGPSPKTEPPEVTFWRDLRARLDGGRDEALRWLDDQRRQALREHHVPDDLVEDVLDEAGVSR